MPTVFRTSGFPQSTTLRGIHSVIGFNYTQRTAVGRSIFNVYDSTQIREHTLTMGGGGLFEQRAEGQATNYVTFNEGFLETYTYVVYSEGFRVTQYMYLNDLYGTMERHGAELGRMALATEETVLANHFNRAFTAAYTGPDGAVLCATDHVREDGVAYRNKPAANSDADLSQTSLEQGLIDFRDFRDGGGKRLMLKPKTVLTAADELFNGWRIMDSPNEPETDNNAINPIQRLNLDHVVWDYMDQSDDWFLLADKSEHYLQLYDRIPFYSEHIYDFDTDDVKYKGVFGQSSGWGDARGIWGTSGA